MANVVLSIKVLEDRLAVCRLGPEIETPEWALKSRFCSVTRTPEELSIICDEANVPEGVQCVRDWRTFKVEGPLDFSLIGVLASVIDPLADEAIGILAVATYDTDYVLVKSGQYERAVAVLAAAGHRINRV